jgi:hypothetical protein
MFLDQAGHAEEPLSHSFTRFPQVMDHAILSVLEIQIRSQLMNVFVCTFYKLVGQLFD